MWKRLILLITFLILSVPILTKAQSTPSLNVLHKVSAAEYLAALPQLMKSGQAEGQTDWSGVLSDDFLFRYVLSDADLSWQQLETAFHWVLGNALYQVDLATWNATIVQAWLNQASIDLDSVHKVTFGDYEMTVTPRDFKGDGDHEWLLTLDDSPQAYFYQTGNYLVAERTADKTYRIIKLPLPWFSEGFAYWDDASGTAQSLLFQDITGNGVPDWVVAVGGIGGGHMNHGQL